MTNTDTNTKILPNGWGTKAWEATAVAHLKVNFTLAAISGGRFTSTEHGLRLPISNGYAVEVDYDHGADLYTVRRTFTRSGVRRVKGELTGVYVDELNRTAYQASCFRNGEFPEETGDIR